MIAFNYHYILEQAQDVLDKSLINIPNGRISNYIKQAIKYLDDIEESLKRLIG